MVTDFRQQWRAALTAEHTSPATSTQRLVGLMLADYMNRENAFAWPSAARLGRRCNLSSRAVRAALHELVEMGFLVVAKEGKGTSNTYQGVLNPGTTIPPTPERGSDPPRNVTTPTTEPRSVTAERRSPELVRTSEEPGAPDAARALEGDAAHARFDPDRVLEEASRL